MAALSLSLPTASTVGRPHSQAIYLTTQRTFPSGSAPQTESLPAQPLAQGEQEVRVRLHIAMQVFTSEPGDLTSGFMEAEALLELDLCLD